MKINFLGAARNVTGSKHLIEVEGKKILLDCGLFQGRRQESFEKNQKLPFDASKIDVVILSHAHIDHSGALPILTKNGFTGKIYCTPATMDITKLMLLDSANIQEQDAGYFARKLSKTALQPIEPLYTQDDAMETIKQFESRDLYKKFRITDNVDCTFFNAGHVLGSAIVFLNIKDKGVEKRLVFSGDLGRPGKQIIKDPDFITEAETLIIESTYGGRIHVDLQTNEEEFARVIRDGAKRGGKIIVPSFSLERTQEIIFTLNTLRRRKKIPNLDIIIDSPLSTKVTEVFKQHSECFDKEAREEFLGRGKNPFENVIFTESTEESKAINQRTSPCIIISASGMCEAGRIRHHLRNGISNPKNTILFVGYQAEHTLGRKIVEGRQVVKIFDEMYPVKATVEVLNGFSGHADSHDLIEFVNKIDNLKNVFIVHGEDDQCNELSKKIGQLDKGCKITIPSEGDTVII